MKKGRQTFKSIDPMTINPENPMYRGQSNLFGEEFIRPSLYDCALHGKVLAQDVIWGRDERPYCPYCSTLLTQLSHEDVIESGSKQC